ncbi:MAG: hypothetical protein V1929_00610 [bacterium]
MGEYGEFAGSTRGSTQMNGTAHANPSWCEAVNGMKRYGTGQTRKNGQSTIDWEQALETARADLGEEGSEEIMNSGACNVKNGQEGFVLFTVMVTTALVMLAAASVMLFADFQMESFRRAREANAAIAIAEAGANEAYAILKANFANKDNGSLFPETSYSGGSYDVTVTSVGSQTAQIMSIGVSGSSTQTVIVDVKDFGAPTPGTDPTGPWAHTLFVNGKATINGAGNCYGSVQCNQDMRVNGTFSWGIPGNPVDVYCCVGFRANGSSVLEGMVYAPSVNAAAGVPRTIQAVPTVAMPTLDLTPYYALAVANGQVFSGGTVSGSIGTIPGGVRWYNGDATFNGGVNYAGCIIATGDINFKGGCTQTKVGQLPAVVSRDGSVTLSGSRTMQGLIYAYGDLTCNGSGTENGTIIVGGNMTLNGSYGLFTYDYSFPSLPGTAGSTNCDVGVTAWQK